MPKPKRLEGVRCECGTYTKFTAYVYAHWDIPMTFTCPKCRQRYIVLNGCVEKEENYDAPSH